MFSDWIAKMGSFNLWCILSSASNSDDWDEDWGGVKGGKEGGREEGDVLFLTKLLFFVKKLFELKLRGGYLQKLKI